MSLYQDVGTFFKPHTVYISPEVYCKPAGHLVLFSITLIHMSKVNIWVNTYVTHAVYILSQIACNVKPDNKQSLRATMVDCCVYMYL